MKLTLADRASLAVRWAQVFRAERQRWAAPVPAGAPARVFYGWEHVPGPAERTGGGLIKCQDLEGGYPNTPHGANLLYLVSSALPVHAPVMARLARRAGARLVVNQDGVAYPAWHGPGWRAANRPLAAVLQQAEHVFYQSRFCKGSADRYLGAPQGPWEVLYNPVDTQVFVPAPVRPAGATLLLAGSHHEWYRVATALAALARLRAAVPEARLIVAGRMLWRPQPETALAEARRLAADLKVTEHVVFRGPYAQAEAVALLQSADILLHTKYNDPCPRLVVEGMACGLPVVYSRSGGVPELVGDTAGLGVEAPLDWEQEHPPDPQQLADATRRVLSAQATFARAARERAVAHFDVRPWFARHQTVFEALTRGAHSLA